MATTPPRTSFFDMARELRDEIYGCLDSVARPNHVDANTSKLTCWLADLRLVSKQFGEEATDVVGKQPLHYHSLTYIYGPTRRTRHISSNCIDFRKPFSLTCQFNGLGGKDVPMAVTINFSNRGLPLNHPNEILVMGNISFEVYGASKKRENWIEKRLNLKVFRWDDAEIDLMGREDVSLRAILEAVRRDVEFVALGQRFVDGDKFTSWTYVRDLI